MSFVYFVFFVDVVVFYSRVKVIFLLNIDFVKVIVFSILIMFIIVFISMIIFIIVFI